MSRCSLLLTRCCCVLLVLLISGCLAAGPPAATVTDSPEHSLRSPDGVLLAQSRTKGSDSLILLNSETEQSVVSIALPGRVAWMAWHPAGDLLVVTTSLQQYSFGTSYQVWLHRCNGQSQPLTRTLADTTLKPSTLAAWGGQLPSLSQPVLGPQGDVLAFLRLHDPPAFDPYLKVMLLHLDGPGEMALGRQPLPGATLSFSRDGEVLSWSPGSGQTFQVQPWLGSTVVMTTAAQPSESVDPVLLELRPLLLQGLLSPEDYRQQWQQRRQP